MCLPVGVCVWFLLVHGYVQSSHFNIPLRLIVPAFGPALPSQTVIIGFTCSPHALCSEEHHFVLHPPFPKTSLLLVPHESFFDISTACIEKIRAPYA